MNKLKKMLAVLLVFVLTVSLMHVTPAEAATKPKMSLSKRTIYVGGSSVYSKTSTYAKGTYTLRVKDRPSRYSITWESSNKSVATVEKNRYKGTVTAIAPGTATITAKVVDKTTTPNTLYTLTCKITVKANCAAVDIVPATVPEMKVGESVTLAGKMYNAAAKEVTKGVEVTDTVKWTSSDTAVATVSSKGVVSAVGEGTATITCYTVQSTSGTYSTLKKATAKDTITVKVIEPEKPAMLEAKQISLKSVKLIFGENYSKLVTKDNLKITRSGAPAEISKVEFDTTGTVATVTMTNELLTSSTYDITLTGTDAKKGTQLSFVSSNGVPVSMKLNTGISGNRVIAGETSTIGFTLYDINGVDITPTNKTSSAYTTYAARIKCSTNDYTKGYCDGQTVWIYQIGTSMNIIGIYDDGKGNAFSASAVVTAVSEASTMNFAGAMVATSSKPAQQLDWSAPNTKLSKSDSTDSNKLVARVMKADGTYIYSDTNSKITFEFPEGYTSPVWFLVNGSVYPITEGTDNVLVKYDGVIIGSLSVTIGPERIPVRIVSYVDGKEADVARMSDSAFATRSNPVISLKLIDNYGDVYPLTSSAGLTVSTGDTSTPLYIYPGAVAADGSIPLNTIITASAGATSGKSYNMVVQYDNGKIKLADTFTVLVYKPIEAMTSSYKAIVTGNTDMIIDQSFNATEGKNLTLTFTELKGEIPYYDCELKDKSMCYTGDYYAVVKDSKGNDAKDATGAYIASSINADGTINIKTVAASGSIITKMLPGAYTVVIYKKNATGNDLPVGHTGFALTDSQEGATFERVNQYTSVRLTKASTQVELDYAFNACFKVYSHGVAVTASVNLSTANLYDDAALIKDVLVNDSINIGGNTYTYSYSLDINMPVIYKAP